MAVVYKILDKRTGLHSMGGIDAGWSDIDSSVYKRNWNKNGKTWNSKGAVKRHLALIKEYNKGIRPDYGIHDDWLILEYPLPDANQIPIKDFK